MSVRGSLEIYHYAFNFQRDDEDCDDFTQRIDGVFVILYGVGRAGQRKPPVIACRSLLVGRRRLACGGDCTHP